MDQTAMALHKVYHNGDDFFDDGIDNDCDGLIDEYVFNEIDDDGDGYNEINGDCDDSNINVYQEMMKFNRTILIIITSYSPGETYS